MVTVRSVGINTPIGNGLTLSTVKNKKVKIYL